MKEFRLTPTIGEVIVVIFMVICLTFGFIIGSKFGGEKTNYNNETVNEIGKIKGDGNSTILKNEKNINENDSLKTEKKKKFLFF